MRFSSSVVFPEFLTRPITADLHLHSDLSNFLDMFHFTAAAAFQSVYECSAFWAHYGAGRFGTGQQLRDRILNALTGCGNTQHRNLFTCTLGIEVPQGSVLGPHHIHSCSVVQTDTCLLLERYQTLTASHFIGKMPNMSKDQDLHQPAFFFYHSRTLSTGSISLRNDFFICL